MPARAPTGEEDVEVLCSRVTRPSSASTPHPPMTQHRTPFSSSSRTVRAASCRPSPVHARLGRRSAASQNRRLVAPLRALPRVAGADPRRDLPGLAQVGSVAAVVRPSAGETVVWRRLACHRSADRLHVRGAPMTTTYTFDIFSSLDGYGSPTSGATGRLLGQAGSRAARPPPRERTPRDQRMVFGANTYRQFVQMFGEGHRGDRRGRGPLGRPDAGSLPTTVVSGHARRQLRTGRT